MMLRRRISQIGILAIAGTLLACEGDNVDIDDDREEITVDIEFDVDRPLLVDTNDDGQPDTEPREIRISFDRIELTHATGRVLSLPSGQEFEVFASGDADWEIIQDVVPVGRYTAMRLFFGPSTIVLDGRTEPLTIPGSEAGILLRQEFCVAGRPFDLDLDEIDLQWRLTSDLLFDRSSGDFLLRTAGLDFQDWPDCD